MQRFLGNKSPMYPIHRPRISVFTRGVVVRPHESRVHDNRHRDCCRS